MKKKKLEELPVVGDTIVFELETFDRAEKVLADPHTINTVTVYFIERDDSEGELYYKTIYNKEIEAQVKSLQTICAEDPCEKNFDELQRAKVRLEATSVKTPYRFKDGRIVHSVGKPAYAGKDNHDIKRTDVGRFEFEWDTTSYKEGNYYIVWAWTPEGGKQLTAQKTFSLYVTPTTLKASAFMEFAPTDKYEFLLKKYTPSMYKTQVAMDDVTAEVLDGLNWCVAREFTYLENVLSLLGECYDANLCPVNMLDLLANFYNIKLRTDNVTLKRRQAKNAIPLLKKKGTREGLETALDQAGIKLKKLSVLWQVRSPYTWTESFTVRSDEDGVFELAKMPAGDKVVVSVRSQMNNEYIELPSRFFMLVDSLEGDKKVLVFQKDEASDVRLLQGDVLKVSYEIRTMPPEFRQLEEYIQFLPLADSRDETKQAYPLKNWNIHLIEEDDPLFDLIVKERHPFIDPITFGKIRTTFLFSENVYNMDTFNGSLRESKEPCHIDRHFLDECTACRSSKFNLDIEVEELSDYRITEAMEIIKEYSPFHAELNTLNICGAVNEFLIMPHEEIECLVDYSPSLSIMDDSITEVMQHEEEITCLIEYTDGRTETLKL